MYTKLTKIIKVDGAECVACAYFGTEECRIHKEEGTPDCCHCRVMGAILNQLHAFEEAITEENVKR